MIFIYVDHQNNCPLVWAPYLSFVGECIYMYVYICLDICIEMYTYFRQRPCCKAHFKEVAAFVSCN